MSTVYVVDDEGSIRTVVNYTLRLAGFGVVTCQDGSEALDKMKKMRCDILLTDIEGYGLRGEYLYDIVRRLNYTFPMIVMTGHDWYADNLGPFEGSIIKPFDIDDLVDCIKKVLAGEKSRHIDRQSISLYHSASVLT